LLLKRIDTVLRHFEGTNYGQCRKNTMLTLGKESDHIMIMNKNSET